jgi:hypothetical protein
MLRLPLVLALLLAAGELSGQEKKRGRCSGDPPDPAWMAAGPVYRDCEVDRKAELRGSEPRLPYTPPVTGSSSGRCYSAELEFVVDTAGVPELSTVRARPANDRDVEEAMRAVLPMRRYQPALLQERPVRQIVVYRVALGVIRVVSASGRPVMPPASPRRPSC